MKQCQNADPIGESTAHQTSIPSDSMIQNMKAEIRSIDEALYYMEESDTAYHLTYALLRRRRRVLLRATKSLERINRKEREVS